MAENAQIKITADTSQAERALGSLTSSLKALVSITAVSALAKQFAVLSDQATNLQNKLNLVTQEGQTSSQLFALMTKSANNLGAPLQEVGDLFFRIANNTKDLGLAQTDQLRITELLMKGFQLTGLTMGEASGAVVQLGQAFGQGVLRGDELNSVLEQLPMVADALAAKYGVVRGALKSLGEQGKISSKDLADAILASGASLDQAYLQRLPTIQNAFNVLSNTFVTLAQKTDESTGLSRAFSYALLIVADAVISVYEWFQKWGGVIGFVVEALLFLYVPIRAAKFVFAALIGPIEWLVGLFRSGSGFISIFGKAFAKLEAYIAPLTGPVTVLGDAIAKLFAGIAAGATLIGLGSLVDGVKNLFNQDTKTMAENYDAKLKDINKRLGVDQVEASTKAKEAGKGLTAQQLKDADAIRKATIDRNQNLKELLQAQNDNLVLTKLEGTELKIQQVVNQANKQLIKEIKNDKGDIIGYTKGLTSEEEAQLRLLELQNIQGVLRRDITQQLTASTQDLSFIQSNITKLTTDQLDVQLKILSSEREYGAALDDEIKKKIQSNEETLKQIGYIKQIQSSLQNVNVPLGGAAAGAQAAGQLGQLDPMNAALTQQTTLFNGLKYLRDQDLISEQQYQTAKMNAAIAANEQIMAATKKKYESEALQRIQSQTGTQFGYETQKQMAQESATFEMKSTQEKTQFALEQGASIFNSLGQQNKKAFEAAKAFNIANAIMNTYMGATKALATYPWPFGLIAAAAAVAAGMAQVSAIRAQTYSGRALGGGVMGNKPYIVGENGPELFTPATGGRITRNQDLNMGGGGTTVNFNITANDTSGFDELLMKRRGLITQVIRDAQLERGQRIGA